MPDTRERTLDALIELSGEMLALAKDGAWEQAMAHQEHRAALLKRLFDGDWPTLTRDLAEKVRRIQALDRALVEIAEKHRDELQQERLEYMRARRSVRVYGDSGGDAPGR